MLQVKAVAAEAAAEVADGVMRLCGGAAFRKELGVERRFRDSLAARVMAPTTAGAARLRRPGHAGPAAVRRERRDATETLLMGAVAYDPKVVTIWEGFRRWLRERGLPFDFVLYSHYERQVEDLVAGRIHAAWNSPLAWLRAERLAAPRAGRAGRSPMRDTDRDLTSVVVVRADSDIASVADLAGRTVAVGAVDSPQATLIPLAHLRDGRRVGRTSPSAGSTSASACTATTSAANATPPGRWSAGEVDAACMIDAQPPARSPRRARCRRAAPGSSPRPRRTTTAT